MPHLNYLNLHKYPFARLLACLIAGVLLQWYLSFSMAVLMVGTGVLLAAVVIFSFLPSSITFRLQWLRGVLLLLLVVATGAVIVYVKDIRHNAQWIGNNYEPKQPVLVTIDEPLVDKPNSYKALATVKAVYQHGKWQKADGDVLLYFYKGKYKPRLQYGAQIILRAGLQPIKNSGNPGAFDYRQYCLMRNIGYQAFVYPGQYTNIWQDGGNSLQHNLFAARDATIAMLQKAIPGEQEQAVAEALLIGYRDTLDPDLVQAYTNTGVIHIIAISGMHLAMIYGALLWLFNRLPKRKTTRIVEAVVIVTVLWGFSLLAGAAPSITRAAVMFTIIVIGRLVDRSASTYNTLAASAFMLLLYNPFYLWDAGFILSYSAVLSIVAFYRPIYKWIYIKSKWLDKPWQAMATTISAQILTIPVILLYFHQLPLVFLLSNLVAVPLSGIILYSEIGLLVVVLVPFVGKWAGVAVYYMIKGLNSFITSINKLPFGLWDNIYADVAQTLLLYAFILSIAWWLLRKATGGLVTGMVFLAALVVYTGLRYININHTQKLVVYNVPHQTAIDVMQAGSYRFIGDSILLTDGKLQRYNIKPARTVCGVAAAGDSLLQPNFQNLAFTVNHTKVLLLDNTCNLADSTLKVRADVIILSKNPKYSMQDIKRCFSFKQLVFDSSNPMWKIRRWKKDCDSLHLRFHSVEESGAFQLDL